MLSFESMVGARVEKDLPDGPSPIQLYSLGTPNGVKVSILLEELAVDYDAHIINIGAGDQFTSGFVKINPNSKIPALLDKDGPDGKPIYFSPDYLLCCLLNFSSYNYSVFELFII